MFIYKITCIPTGLIYVGQTRRNPYDRLREHFALARNEPNSTQPIIEAIRTHGEKSFTLEVLESECTTQDQLDRMERFWIQQLQTLNPEIGYNATVGGQHGAVIVDVERRSLATKYTWENKETRERRLVGMRAAHRNKPIEDAKATNEKISKAAKQQWADPEKREKAISGMKIAPHPPLTHAHKLALSRVFSGINNPQFGKPWTKEQREHTMAGRAAAKAMRNSVLTVQATTAGKEQAWAL